MPGGRRRPGRAGSLLAAPRCGPGSAERARASHGGAARSRPLCRATAWPPAGGGGYCPPRAREVLRLGVHASLLPRVSPNRRTGGGFLCVFRACDGDGASWLPQGAADRAERGWCPRRNYLELGPAGPVSALTQELGRNVLFVGQAFRTIEPSKGLLPGLLMRQLGSSPSFRKASAQQVLLAWFSACFPSENTSTVPPGFSMNPNLGSSPWALTNVKPGFPYFPGSSSLP